MIPLVRSFETLHVMEPAGLVDKCGYGYERDHASRVPHFSSVLSFPDSFAAAPRQSTCTQELSSTPSIVWAVVPSMSFPFLSPLDSVVLSDCHDIAHHTVQPQRCPVSPSTVSSDGPFRPTPCPCRCRRNRRPVGPEMMLDTI